jgi:hypothetical protein
MLTVLEYRYAPGPRATAAPRPPHLARRLARHRAHRRRYDPPGLRPPARPARRRGLAGDVLSGRANGALADVGRGVGSGAGAVGSGAAGGVGGVEKAGGRGAVSGPASVIAGRAVECGAGRQALRQRYPSSRCVRVVRPRGRGSAVRITCPRDAGGNGGGPPSAGAPERPSRAAAMRSSRDKRREISSRVQSAMGEPPSRRCCGHGTPHGATASTPARLPPADEDRVAQQPAPQDTPAENLGRTATRRPPLTPTGDANSLLHRHQFTGPRVMVGERQEACLPPVAPFHEAQRASCTSRRGTRSGAWESSPQPAGQAWRESILAWRQCQQVRTTTP